FTGFVARNRVCALFASWSRLPSEWRPLSEGCRAELAEIIIYARVLAIHRETLSSAGGLYNSLPFGLGYGYESAEEGLLYSAEVELLCDQAWGSMLEVPTGSRLNLTGLGYLSCQMDENYNLLPHGVNFQDAIFVDTTENRHAFSSLFQFSNCSMAQQPLHHYSPEWDAQEDSRLMCSSVQAALFEEEEKGRKLQDRLSAAERRNRKLRDRVKKVKRSLKKARKAVQKAEEETKVLRERVVAAERRAGLHLNAIDQTQSTGYRSRGDREEMNL
uniref:Coiled-coil domain containing 3a n=1 Tax=Neogobius melanostomus TaxID=47308 RepID=A0A8C6WVT0_9GOBI